MAIYEALSTSLKNLGDSGRLSYDNTHAQEGLPCMLQTYVLAQWIYNRYGYGKSFVGSKVNVSTSTLVTQYAIPGINGTPVGTSDTDMSLAQDVARKVCKSHYFDDITALEDDFNAKIDGMDLVIDGGLDIDSVHLEVILANQIVTPDNVLVRPNWNNPYAQYKLLTLDHALVNNPSIVVTLLYKNLHKVLYDPLSFSKHAPSFFDLFFCEQPQVYMSDGLFSDDVKINDPDKGIEMVKIVDKEGE
jgi:hypothetical protein